MFIYIYVYIRLHAISSHQTFQHTHTHAPGANRADGHTVEWVSILVRTGVFKDDEAHPAKYVVDDVKAALQLIMELEGKKFH